MDLLARGHWIFDMDGTLTHAAHDFQSFKRDNGMPLDRPILEHIAECAPSHAAHLRQRLEDWEEGIARRAEPAEDAVALLAHLREAGRSVAILTRNTRRLALVTLEAAGMLDHFHPDVILGRDSATPKPSPDGVQHILRRWRAPARDAVMVGDYLFDIEAGRAAGAATVLIDRARQAPTWASVADRVVHRLDALLG